MQFRTNSSKIKLLRQKENGYMRITLNGKEKELNSSLSLKETVAQFREDTRHVIAEVNGEIIRTPQWENTPIKEGDSIELVSLVGGG